MRRRALACSRSSAWTGVAVVVAHRGRSADGPSGKWLVASVRRARLRARRGDIVAGSSAASLQLDRDARELARWRRCRDRYSRSAVFGHRRSGRVTTLTVHERLGIHGPTWTGRCSSSGYQPWRGSRRGAAAMVRAAVADRRASSVEWSTSTSRLQMFGSSYALALTLISLDRPSLVLAGREPEGRPSGGRDSGSSGSLFASRSRRGSSSRGLGSCRGRGHRDRARPRYGGCASSRSGAAASSDRSAGAGQPPLTSPAGRSAAGRLLEPGRPHACGWMPSARSISRAAATTAGAYRLASARPDAVRSDPRPRRPRRARRAARTTGALTEATPASRSPKLSVHPRRRPVRTCGRAVVER